MERAEKRLKGIENVKPEYQDEYERLEAELERFYNIYVEKFTNMDYLEYELDMYNLKEQAREKENKAVISMLQKGHEAGEVDELLDDDGKKNGDKF